jgi:hypothetical protein
VISAVLGFALQDVLKNVFAGLALQTEAPFDLGDWLLIDHDPRQVLEMSWRSTHLRNNLGINFREPNANLANREITNLGTGRVAMGFEVEVGVAYGAPPALVKRSLERAAASSALVAPEPKWGCWSVSGIGGRLPDPLLEPRRALRRAGARRGPFSRLVPAPPRRLDHPVPDPHRRADAGGRAPGAEGGARPRAGARAARADRPVRHASALDPGAARPRREADPLRRPRTPGGRGRGGRFDDAHRLRFGRDLEVGLRDRRRERVARDPRCRRLLRRDVAAHRRAAQRDGDRDRPGRAVRARPRGDGAVFERPGGGGQPRMFSRRTAATGALRRPGGAGAPGRPPPLGLSNPRFFALDS